MAMANLDLQDLNALLVTYQNKKVELEQKIDKLRDIQSTTNSLGLRVGKDFLNKTTYIDQEKIESDFKAFNKELAKILEKVNYVKGLMEEETSASPFTMGRF